MDASALDLAVRYAAYPVAGAILANQVEELFLDGNYLFRGLHRRDERRLSADALRAVPTRRIAIFVPAWREDGVIERMLEHNVTSIDYDAGAFEIFCGTYRNDAETRARVDAVAARHPSVHRVDVPRNGPTSKADCLNCIWRGMLAEERRRNVHFEILVLHDAEDVIHPLALRLFAKLVPEHGAVQVPVFSLDRRCRDLVAGTYIDEFAEFHLKELPTREAMGGLVPSAGVGTAFERGAFEALAATRAQQPFDAFNLTEDYDIALRLRLAGKKLHFACHTVESPSGPEGFGRPGAGEEFIATREYFPHPLGAAVRQRGRWICGIALQAWERFGWPGDAAVRYSLWRDRKGLANGLLVAFAYFLVTYLLARWAFSAWTGHPWSSTAVIPPGSVLEWLLFVNLLGLCWRAAWKFAFVRTLYGWRHGLLALPRLVIGNFVVIAATARAVRAYVRHRVTGTPLRWIKTDHAFPDPNAIPMLTPVPGRAPTVAVSSASPAELLLGAAVTPPPVPVLDTEQLAGAAAPAAAVRVTPSSETIQ
jgi:bacteriophage N4 adsorption protein B